MPCPDPDVITQEDEHMKKVLLLGDSIRQNYQPLVTEKLAGRAEIIAPTANCCFAGFTLTCLTGWLRDLGTPDIVHWNNGLWDTVIRFSEDGAFTPVEEYVRTMGRILRELKKTGAHVIFATSTPVRDGHANQTADRVKWYNHSVLPLMLREGVDVNDLWSVVYPRRDELICDDLCHLSDLGKELCAQAVVKSIEKYL
jgi:hypothetical protein